MIHDIHPDYFQLNLDGYRLTFDDGLFSQYYYFPLLKNHPGQLTYFITTSFIHPGSARNTFAGGYLAHLKSKKYMYRWFVENRRDHFMTLEELQAISLQPNTRIGVHSHFHDVILTGTHPKKRKPPAIWKTARLQQLPGLRHYDLSIRSKLAFRGYRFEDGVLKRRSETDWEDYIKYDTELAVKWMEDHLGFAPELYCFPFNEHNAKLVTILKTFGFKSFFSARPGNCPDVLGRIDIDRLIDI